MHWNIDSQILCHCPYNSGGAKLEAAYDSGVSVSST